MVLLHLKVYSYFCCVCCESTLILVESLALFLLRVYPYFVAHNCGKYHLFAAPLPICARHLIGAHLNLLLCFRCAV